MQILQIPKCLGLDSNSIESRPSVCFFKKYNRTLSSTLGNLCEILLCKTIESRDFGGSLKVSPRVLSIKLPSRGPEPKQNPGVWKNMQTIDLGDALKATFHSISEGPSDKI